MSDELAPPLEQLIGYDTIARPYESWYAFVSRLIRANLLNDADIRTQLPALWMRWALAPQGIQPGDLLLPDTLRALWDEPELKFRPATWDTFPELSSIPPECLRICPQCVGIGTHSYAMQSDLLARCPIHGDALVHRCPHCDTPLYWQARTPSKSAFFCPAGCSLSDGTASGLSLSDDVELEGAWQVQRDWIRVLTTAIRFVSGPVHISYPPYLEIAPLRLPPLPSAGLGPALLQALHRHSVELPTWAPHHAQSPGQWVIEMRPWTTEFRDAVDEAKMEGFRRSFRRGAYRTYLPLVRSAAAETWLARSTNAHGRWLGGGIEEGQHCSVIALDSFLVTNNEVTALRRLLARGTDPATACSHYEVFLFELLEYARRRRVALDNLKTPSPEVRVAESFDGVLETPAGRWRVSGRTESNDDARSTWVDLREQAEMGTGMIYITRRVGPR